MCASFTFWWTRPVTFHYHVKSYMNILPITVAICLLPRKFNNRFLSVFSLLKVWRNYKINGFIDNGK